MKRFMWNHWINLFLSEKLTSHRIHCALEWWHLHVYRLKNFSCAHATEVAMHRDFPLYNLYFHYYIADFGEQRMSKVYFSCQNKPNEKFSIKLSHLIIYCHLKLERVLLDIDVRIEYLLKSFLGYVNAQVWQWGILVDFVQVVPFAIIAWMCSLYLNL